MPLAIHDFSCTARKKTFQELHPPISRAANLGKIEGQHERILRSLRHVSSAILFLRDASPWNKKSRNTAEEWKRKPTTAWRLRRQRPAPRCRDKADCACSHKAP